MGAERASRGGQQVLDRSRVVTKHGTLADAETPAAFEMDHVAVRERRCAEFHRLTAALHAEVGSDLPQRFDDGVGAALQVPFA